MNLQEILQRKKEGEGKEEKLLAFLLLFYTSHPRDTCIDNGEGAKLLFNWLGLEPTKQNEITKDILPFPIGIIIKDQYILNSILGLHPNVIYTVLEKFKLAKNLEFR